MARLKSKYHCSWGQLLTTCSNASEVAQWSAFSFSRTQPADDNGVRDGKSDWQAVIPPTLYRATLHEHHLHMQMWLQINCVVSGIDPGTLGTLGHRIAYAATQAWVAAQMFLELNYFAAKISVLHCYNICLHSFSIHTN